jgi:hypothetical protein
VSRISSRRRARRVVLVGGTVNDETRVDMKGVPDPKVLREKAKQLAEQRRTERKNRKRKCALCGVEENEKAPFVPHADGIGPTCKEPSMCEHYRAARAAR